MPRRPLPVLPGVYYSIVRGAWEGRPSNNVFTFQVLPTPATGAADVLMADFVGTAIATSWGALANVAFHSTYHASEVQTYPLNTPINPAVVTLLSANGGMSETLTAGMVAAAVAHSVVRRGRGSQSRSSFSPMGNTGIDSTGTQLSTAHRDSMQTAFDNFIAAVKASVLAAAPGTTTNYVQLSKGTSSGTPPVIVAPAVYQIVNSVVELPLTTQRRRMRRNG
jgi:hypothetical protein